MDNLAIRPVAGRPDVELVAALAREIWGAHYTPIIGRVQVDYMLENFQSAAAIDRQVAAGCEYYLVTSAAAAVGYFALAPDPAGGGVQLSKIYLRAEFRGRGIGREILAFAERRCAVLGAGRLWLTVNRHNAGAIAFYRRTGFVSEGPVARDIGGGFVMDDYLMARVINRSPGGAKRRKRKIGPAGSRGVVASVLCEATRESAMFSSPPAGENAGRRKAVNAPDLLPKVRLGNSDLAVTRLISGGNPLCGSSHLSDAMSAEMREYFTAEQVVAYFHRLQAAGINTLQARGDYHRILHWLELFRREGGQLHWIAQNASEMHDFRQNIRVLAAAGAAAIYHHGTRTDRFWQEGCIGRVRDDLKFIRDCGVQVGLGTHIPEVIEHAEAQGWDLDFYMASFYNLSRKPRESALVDSARAGEPERFPPEDPPRMCRVIRQTRKMCLAFKILAASRRCLTQEHVAAAFRDAFSGIKPGDAVVVGMFPKHLDQVALNVGHALAACRGADAA